MILLSSNYLWLILLINRHSVDYNDMKGLVSEVSGMQEQLQELTDQVLKLVEEGDAEGALGLIDANLEVLAEQLESGYRGMEQVAMLDTLASLKMSMGEYEETETLLDQVRIVTDPSRIVLLLNISSFASSIPNMCMFAD